MITRQQIEQRAPRNSSDLFEDMAGVYTTTDRQNPGVTINIRGLQEQGRVNVMIDGARQNFQQAGHDAVSSVYFDPELIGGIVVEKGPTSTVGGAGVIGGVVSLRTLEADDILLPGKTFGTRSRITVGTNEFRYTASEAVAARNEQVEFVAAVARKETGAYQPGQNGTLQYVGPGEPVIFTGQDNLSGLTKLTWRPTPDQMIKLGYVALNNNFSTGQGEFIDTNQLFTQSATADYSWKPANRWIDFNARAWWSSTDNHQFRPARTAYGAFDLQYGLNSFGGSAYNTSRFDIPLFNVTWTNGLEYFKDQTKTGVITDQTNPSDAEWFSGPTPAGARDIASGIQRNQVQAGRVARTDRRRAIRSILPERFRQFHQCLRRVRDRMYAALLGRQVGRTFLPQVHCCGDALQRLSVLRRLRRGLSAPADHGDAAIRTAHRQWCGFRAQSEPAARDIEEAGGGG